MQLDLEQYRRGAEENVLKAVRASKREAHALFGFAALILVAAIFALDHHQSSAALMISVTVVATALCIKATRS